MDRLVAVWETGTTLTATVFKLDPRTDFSEVLFEGNTEGDPDFIHGDKGDEIMLLYEGRRFLANNTRVPERALIYTWIGFKCRLLKTVPYADRFRSLQGTGSVQSEMRLGFHGLNARFDTPYPADVAKPSP
jgi:hypothetical protein